MSVIGSNILAGASGQGGGYNLTNSLRFRSSASAYLNRTPASAGNRKTWTWSGWVKRGSLSYQLAVLFGSRPASSASDSNTLQFGFNSSNQFSLGLESAFYLISTPVYRDPSAWYHVVLTVDTTQATASNRIRAYINNNEITSWGTDLRSSISQNADLGVNIGSQLHQLGSLISNSWHFDGYLTEVNFIDGQALTPSSFGETSTTTGVWQPKKYAGTYGTNGFYLPFTDNSALTTSSNVGLGKDFSGNGNYWTTNNISITSGATYDSMTDVPTLTDETSSNYAVFSPIAPASQTNSEANLKVSTASTGATPSTILPSSGKWYAEIALVSGTFHRVGVCNANGIAKDLGGSADGWCYLSDARVYNNGATTSYGVSSTNGDIINIALDLDAGKIWYGKNGTWMASGSPSTGANPSQTFTANQTMAFAVASGSGTIVYTGNFGQRPFAYTPPTGFVALNTFNLPTPTIGATASSQANKYFNPVLYTGNGADPRTISGVGFAPDFTWIKRRSAADNHILVNKLTSTNFLQSNTTDAEGSASSVFQALASDGFTVGNDTSVNASGSTYVAWNWKANGTGVTNTAGSITSTVSANTTSGFSVVTYTGTGSAATVGHGLGVAPKMIIVKNRVQGTYGNWNVWHTAITGSQYLSLNLTDSVSTNNNRWNGTVPTSTVFSLGADSFGNTNKSGDTYVAYVFSEVQGYSKFGSYTGNGSTDGTFVFTGFRPRFVMIKRTDSTGEWWMYDTARGTYNAVNMMLLANSSGSENADSSSYLMDINSNGFKWRSGLTASNASGGSYVYMAFAENPFKYSLAR